MGRVNKFTDGVFCDIVGNSTEISSYDRFINVNSNIDVVSEECTKYLNIYRSKVNEVKDDLNHFALLEQIIMQIRTRDNVSDIKLSIVRDEYIYARCPFYRNDKDSKDIRVIVGLVEFYGSDTKKLSQNTEFMEKAKSKIIDAMNVEIENSIFEYEKIFK